MNDGMSELEQETKSPNSLLLHQCFFCSEEQWEPGEELLPESCFMRRAATGARNIISCGLALGGMAALLLNQGQPGSPVPGPVDDRAQIP